MRLEPLRTAVIGCGTISSMYLQNGMSWEILDIVACADLDRVRRGPSRKIPYFAGSHGLRGISRPEHRVDHQSDRTRRAF